MNSCEKELMNLTAQPRREEQQPSTSSPEVEELKRQFVNDELAKPSAEDDQQTLAALRKLSEALRGTQPPPAQAALADLAKGQ